ncbi:MAG TPA: DUF4349 domain-containing protein [Mycobacteriales bacterium]|jgi:hypothetical protein|nr:DUF4349 domain-containing protein [Mycobacteriales bacterium]
MRRTGTAWGAALVLALLVTGCGSADRSSAGGRSGNLSARDHVPANGAAGASAAAGGNGGGAVGVSGTGARRPAAVGTAAALGRQVVRTGTMTVRVEDVEAAGRAVSALAERSGGYLESAETGLATSSTLTLRVPPERFTATADAVARLGVVAARHFDSEDVTSDVADVDGRLAAARASVARLRSLLAKAASVSEVTQLEGELTDREAELESLASRSRALAESTGLATLTVTLERPAPPTPARAAPKPKVSGFTGGLKAGTTGLLALLSVLLVVVGVLLPFAAVVAAVVVPVLLWARRRRGRYEAAAG